MHVLSRQNNSSRLKKNVISSYTGKYWVYQVLEINFSDPLSRSLEGHKLIHDSTYTGFSKTKIKENRKH